MVLYTGVTLSLLACAAPATLREHTPYNHFALQAEAWLEGRLDLGRAPPGYTGGNDFARYEGKWFVVFPAFPSVLILPLVAAAGSAEAVVDGRFFLLLAGLAPATLFLAMERLRQRGESRRSELENVVFACLYCFGSVYFFCSLQGTVWFAAHVVAAVLTALYLLFALGAERPLLAGACLGLGFATRTPLLLAAPLFVLEALRATRLPSPAGPGLWQRFDVGRLTKMLVSFLLPLGAVVASMCFYNAARFHDALEPGYRYLNVAWAARIAKWGLFDYHYLAKNLGVMLTSLPWLPAESGPVQISGHGLALWFTTPMYLWLLVARRWTAVARSLLGCAALVALPTLFYQNTGWVQFGYRFSLDYTVFLMMLLALGGRPFRKAAKAMIVFGILVNLFGAITFDRYWKYYRVQGDAYSVVVAH